MSVRILHAADLHLDSPFEALSGAQAAQRRREQRDLLRALPELAKAHGAQIILLAGDLLDSGSPYPETAKALAETIKLFDEGPTMSPRRVLTSWPVASARTATPWWFWVVCTRRSHPKRRRRTPTTSS